MTKRIFFGARERFFSMFFHHTRDKNYIRLWVSIVDKIMAQSVAVRSRQILE
jgi:hypothetical protein